MTDYYPELYELFARRFHPLVAAIMAHECAKKRTGLGRIIQRYK